VPDDIDATVARLISEGKVVGYFQGRMELGPRALGCRSIVADPRDRAMREILNQKVKHREYFRPLAPSVLAEDVADWMDVPGDTLAADMMLVTYRAKEDKKPQMGAVLHVDDTCRLQAVSAATNPRFHRMISEFKKITGVPMVLNTSFNDQEPIICTPADAIATFEKTQIDYLAAGSFLVAKV
jgi:carbamoyltransferase